MEHHAHKPQLRFGVQNVLHHYLCSPLIVAESLAINNGSLFSFAPVKAKRTTAEEFCGSKCKPFPTATVATINPPLATLYCAKLQHALWGKLNGTSAWKRFPPYSK